MIDEAQRFLNEESASRLDLRLNVGQICARLRNNIQDLGFESVCECVASTLTNRVTDERFIADEVHIACCFLMGGRRLQRHWVLDPVLQVHDLNVLERYLIRLIPLSPVGPLGWPWVFRLILHIKVTASLHVLHVNRLLFCPVEVDYRNLSKKVIYNVLEWNTFYNLSVHFPREVVKLGDRAMNLAYSLIYLSLDLC